MDLQAEKLNVLQQIINSDDLNLIRDIKNLLNARELDWFEELSETQQKDVETGISQLNKGNFLTHEEVKSKFKI